jgi:hypothetical protein
MSNESSNDKTSSPSMGSEFSIAYLDLSSHAKS